MSTELIVNEETIKENQSRENIDFYIRHLSLPELKVVEWFCKTMAQTYSQSYKDWYEEANG